MNPKETYRLTFPAGIFDGEKLKLRQAKSCLLRQFVTHPAWAESTELRPTKLHVFVNAARDEQLVHLGSKPRVEFRMPQKGRIFTIDLTCNCPVISGDLTQLEESDFDISGIEPLDISSTPQRFSGDVFEGNTPSNNVQKAAVGTLSCADDTLWYHIPPVIEGLKNKNSQFW